MRARRSDELQSKKHRHGAGGMREYDRIARSDRCERCNVRVHRSSEVKTRKARPLVRDRRPGVTAPATRAVNIHSHPPRVITPPKTLSIPAYRNRWWFASRGAREACAGKDRYVGEHEGTSLWIAEGVEASSVCLVALRGDSEGFISCGGTSGVATQGQAGSFTVIPDSGFTPDNAMKISENVYATTP